jgi:hypothetical protein
LFTIQTSFKPLLFKGAGETELLFCSAFLLSCIL